MAAEARSPRTGRRAAHPGGCGPGGGGGVPGTGRHDGRRPGGSGPRTRPVSPRRGRCSPRPR
ncbi:hypothetical protein F3L20_16805 [Streptomyces tendae]|uniref:Uncharacterized protein n=1 Tax=Streptomyces tendae TaxID=1932 RepID=A0ABX5ZRM8_STRTE|nr:hypothetical protein F3L20_16805 [Streptomyces tendae]